MNRFKVVVTYYGLTILIGCPIVLLILWVWSFGTPEGMILTNAYGERFIETILLVIGVPCAMYVLYKFVRRNRE